MPKVGKLGLDMMYRTCTVQANLDFSSEADMVKKLRVSLALQPVATALFANSPFTEGQPNGFLSFRSEIWRDTDPDRTGMLPLAFEPGMGYERYVDYALDVPMYFVKRGDRYIDVAGRSFRDLLSGEAPGLPGERATSSDWANHLSTIFPEVRLKRYLEMRGADGGPSSRLPAQAGVLGRPALRRRSARAAWEHHQAVDRGGTPAPARRSPAPRLQGAVRGRDLLSIARETLALSRAGLKRRDRLDPYGADETRYLVPLDEFVERAAPRRKSCSRNSTARGAARSTRLIAEYAG